MWGPAHGGDRTDAVMTADIGGLAAADAICESGADAARLDGRFITPLNDNQLNRIRVGASTTRRR